MEQDKRVATMVGELGAYRAAMRLTAKALRNALSTVEPIAKALLVEQFQEKLKEQQGELLHFAPMELPPALQSAMNLASQEAFASASSEVIEILLSDPPQRHEG